MFPCVTHREGRSNAHIKGDYQRIGDVLLKNIQGLRVNTSPCTTMSCQNPNKFTFNTSVSCVLFLQQLTIHLQKHSECLVELERACRSVDMMQDDLSDLLPTTSCPNSLFIALWKKQKVCTKMSTSSVSLASTFFWRLGHCEFLHVIISVLQGFLPLQLWIWSVKT